MRRILWLFLGLAAATAGAEPALGIKPGEYTEFAAPFGPQLRQFASDANKQCESTGALAAVAVPADFTPDRVWPVLLVSATSDPGYNSSRKLLRRFMAPALKAGWIVIAADASSEKDEDSNNLRYALLIAAIERLRLEWPQLPTWPRAFGGFSGGAKRSASLAAMSQVLGRPPIGVFQGGCNEPVMRYVLGIFKTGKAPFLQVPVFLSGGDEDPIATPDQVREVAADLRRTGFQHVRDERFAGRHEVHAEHVEEALRWFAGLALRPAPGRSP